MKAIFLVTECKIHVRVLLHVFESRIHVHYKFYSYTVRE